MHFKSRFLLVLAWVGLGLVACNKYEDFPAPPLQAGDCQYQREGLSQSNALSEMNRIAAIFEDATLGSYAVAVKSKNVYVSTTKNGEPYTWGFQIVFGCDGAEIKFERSGNYSLKSHAENELNKRLSILQAGRMTKVLTYGVKMNSWTECETCCGTVCDTCYDENDEPYDCNCGEECWDCNCRTYYEYYYTITYLIVNPNNLRQSNVAKQFLTFQETLPNRPNGDRPQLSDTLQAAKKFIPEFTAEGRLVRDWHKLITAVDSHQGLPPKKECPDRLLKKLKGKEPNSTPLPNSQHWVLPSKTQRP